MRFFSAKIYKNIIWGYLTILICFGYTLLLNAIPDHIYIQKGDEIRTHFTVPIEFERTEDEKEVFKEQARWQDSMNSIAFAEPVEGTEYACVCKLFGIIPVKKMRVTEIDKESVFVSGRVVGIYGKTSGVLVLNTTEVTGMDGIEHAPAENRIFPGDYILAVNGFTTRTKEELIQAINMFGSEDIVLDMKRKGEYVKVLVHPTLVNESTYMLGIWVKDDLAGIGTLTYYTKDRVFGALGHGIGDGETGQLLSMATGNIYATKLLGVTKGQRGTPGELEGIIYYGINNQLGQLVGNNSLGIYGVLDEEDYLDYAKEDALLEIGYKQELELGEAYILSEIDGTVKAYRIEITDIDYQEKDSNKGLHFTVTDEKLLDKTGGIVQGMSGSPIVQNGKLVGAVTHVLVNDPAKGYGIFIETMLERDK